MLATRVDVPFTRPGWVFEPKYDGWRGGAARRRRPRRPGPAPHARGSRPRGRAAGDRAGRRGAPGRGPRRGRRDGRPRHARRLELPAPAGAERARREAASARALRLPRGGRRLPLLAPALRAPGRARGAPREEAAPAARARGAPRERRNRRFREGREEGLGGRRRQGPRGALRGRPAFAALAEGEGASRGRARDRRLHAPEGLAPALRGAPRRAVRWEGAPLLRLRRDGLL